LASEIKLDLEAIDSNGTCPWNMDLLIIHLDIPFTKESVLAATP
jgi:hypothetical protein